MGVAKEEGLLTQENREKELRTWLKAGLKWRRTRKLQKLQRSL